jgi:peptidoglycan hydrolase-like protein with peptidoglycan-binding domain
LVIGGYDQYSVDLTWIVTSENTDISYEYDIRYSTSPITEANYGSATEAQLTPVYHGDLDPEGTERNYIVAGLAANTTYYFAVKSKHQTSDWSPVSNVASITTTNGTSIVNESAHTSASVASSQSSGGGSGLYHARQEYGSGSGGNAVSSFEPTTLRTEPADNQIIFEWNNPGEENFVRTVVVRKEGGYPNSPSDGQTIYEGRGETFTDTNVVNGKTYYYALYSYNHSKKYSAPVRVSLAPKAGNAQITFNESGSLVSMLPTMHFVRSHKRGDKNIEVEHLQEILALEDVSFPEKMITGYFGSITENALKKFQAKHNLLVTGIVDTATQAKLNTISMAETRLQIPGDFVMFNTDMKFGDEGEVVKDLQEFLAYEGSYLEAIISGYFGNITRAAVMKFQEKYNITPVSGYVGYKTRHRMQQLTGF